LFDQFIAGVNRYLRRKYQFTQCLAGDRPLLSKMHDGLRRRILLYFQTQELARIPLQPTTNRQIFAKVAKSGICPVSTRDKVAGLRPTSMAVACTPRPPRLAAISRPSTSIGKAINPREHGTPCGVIRLSYP